MQAILAFVVALGAFTYCIARVRMWLMKDDGTRDERDWVILASAPSAQAPAMMVTLEE